MNEKLNNDPSKKEPVEPEEKELHTPDVHDQINQFISQENAELENLRKTL